LSNTLCLFSSLNVRDQVSQPYRTTGKIIVLYVLMLRFSTADEKTEGSGPSGSNYSQTNLLYFFKSKESTGVLLCWQHSFP
jgi:hypothetical protein